MRPFVKWRLALCFAMLVGCAALLAACGGSSSSSTSSETSAAATKPANTGSKEGAEESGGTGVKPPVTEPPTEFPITTPLKETPKPQKLTWLACALPVCQSTLSEGMHQAAATLGWPIKQVNFEQAKAADGVQTALNENPDFIAITGVAPELFEAQAKEAIEKEIPILSGYEVARPEPTKNGIWYQYSWGPHGSGAQGEEIARWIVQDSGGKANVATVTLGEYPILDAEIEGIEKVFAEAPEMSLGTIAVTPEEIGEGKVPSKVIAYLQTHPETEYLEYTFSDLLLGVGAALKGAGLTDQVKQVGVQASEAVIKGIASGELAAWTQQPSLYGDWLTLDAAARIAQGMPLEPYQKEGYLPTYVIDSKEEAEELLASGNGEWNGPEGFEQKFEELWGVK